MEWMYRERKILFRDAGCGACRTLLLFWTLGIACLQSARGDVWSDAEATRQQVHKLRKSDPKAAAQVLEQALNQVTNSNVAAEFFTILGDLYTADLKEPDKALALFDRALPLFQKPEHQVPAYHWIGMIGSKARALLETKRATEAEALLRENMPQLIEAGQSNDPYAPGVVHGALRAYESALLLQSKSNEIPGLLAQFLWSAPRYLAQDPRTPSGWMLQKLLDILQKQGRIEEALGWAKLSYRLCAFNKDDIERATQQLNKLWAEQENFPAVRLFSKAQTDPGVANPLATVKLPEMPAAARESVQQRVTEFEGKQLVDFGPGKTREIVTRRVLLGTPADLHEAMLQAQKLLKARPDLQDGALQICRVFKAVDYNLIRANAFLDYLEGKGENPVPGFLQEMESKAKPEAKPESPATTPAATPSTPAPAAQTPQP